MLKKSYCRMRRMNWTSRKFQPKNKAPRAPQDFSATHARDFSPGVVVPPSTANPLPQKKNERSRRGPVSEAEPAPRGQGTRQRSPSPDNSTLSSECAGTETQRGGALVTRVPAVLGAP